MASFSSDAILNKYSAGKHVQVRTLRDICDQYYMELSEIHFLKIDVEG